MSQKVVGSYEKGIKMTPEYFGVLWPYIQDDRITDIDYNGRDVWITTIENQRIKTELQLTELFEKQFCERVANSVSANFTKQDAILEAQTERLRISIGHESFARTGRTICIRKTLPFTRFTATEAVDSGYCQVEMLHLLANCVLAGCRIVIGGDVGVGKTEFGKFLSKYIPVHERVLTIEDSLEWHYPDINPGADAVSLQVNKFVNYSDAIKFALRQHTSRIMLSEARGPEVKELMEAWSTGTSGIATIHLDHVRKVVDRLLNMMPTREDADRFERNAYQFVDVGVLIAMKNIGKDGKDQMIRRVEEVCFFDYDYDAEKPLCYMMLEDGKLCENRKIPYSKEMKMKRKNIENPWRNSRIEKELQEKR